MCGIAGVWGRAEEDVVRTMMERMVQGADELFAGYRYHREIGGTANLQREL